MLIIAASLAILVYGLIAPVLGMLLPTYTTLDAGQQGWLMDAQALGLVLSSLSAGPFIDKRGNKFALVLGLLLVALFGFTAPSTHSYHGLLIIYFVLGFGGGIVVTAANALIGAVEPTRRGAALNFLNLFFGLGGILTTFAGNRLQPITLCYAIAMLTVVAFVVNIGTKMPAPSGTSNFQAKDVPKLLGTPALILLCLFLFLYVACEVGVWNWMNLFLLNERGFSKADAGNIIAYGFAFGILLGRIVMSRLLVRVSTLTATLIAPAAIAVTMFAALRVPNSVGIAIAVFCAGLSMAPMFPTILAIVGDTFPRGTATAMGIAITCGWLGLVVSSPIIAYVKQQTNLATALMLIPLFGVLMVVVNLVLRGVLRKPVTA